MDFAQVKKGHEENQIVLVDVRNPDEVKSMGKIPGTKTQAPMLLR